MSDPKESRVCHSMSATLTVRMNDRKAHEADMRGRAWPM